MEKSNTFRQEKEEKKARQKGRLTWTKKVRRSQELTFRGRVHEKKKSKHGG